MREIFWLWIYPFQAILSKFGFCGRKALPLPQDEGKFFDFGSIHFRWFWATLAFVAEKPRLQDEGKFFDFGSIHFRWFWPPLLFVAEKPHPPPGGGKIFLTFGSIHTQLDFAAKFGFCGRKAPPTRTEGKFFASLDLSISGDFDQLCFLWQKSPPSPRMREIFLTLDLSISVQFWASLLFCGRKAPPPQDEGKFFDFGSIHFRWFWASLVFGGRKAPPPSFLPFGEILGSCCSTWCNFTDWYFMHHWISHWWQVGRKVHPTRWGINFWLQIYPFQAILSKFGFCGRKAPPPPSMRENFSDFGSIHFRWFWATLLFVAEKPPPPQDEGKFFDFASIHFRWFWATLLFVAEKSPPPLFLPFGEILSLCCSTWCNFKDWYFMHHWISHWWQVGRKAPPQDEGNFFDFRFIHFRQFWATLVFVAEKLPPPQHEGKFFDFGSINFR